MNLRCLGLLSFFAIAMTMLYANDAEARPFRSVQQLNLNSGGGGSVQQLNLNAGGGFSQRLNGGQGLLGGLLAPRVQQINVNTAPQQFNVAPVQQINLRQGLLAPRVQQINFNAPPAFVTSQLLVDSHHRGQLNQLNTYTLPANTAQNIRFVKQRTEFLTTPLITSTPIVERQYITSQPQQVIQQVQQEPQRVTTDQCPCNQQTSNAQYITQPQRLVQYYTVPQQQTLAVTDATTYELQPQALRVQHIHSQPLAIISQRTQVHRFNLGQRHRFHRWHHS